MCDILHRLQQNGQPVENICCDNAGENKKLQEINKYGMNIKFENTAEATPEQNSPAEKVFDMLDNMGRAMMTSAHIQKETKYSLFREAFTHAMNLNILVLVTINDMEATRFEHCDGMLPKWVSHMQTWGEAGVIKYKLTSTSKIANRGDMCMSIGYEEDHVSNYYHMYNPKTRRVHTTRDVKWLLKQMVHYCVFF